MATIEDMKKMGLIEVNGIYVKASSQVAKGKVEKLPNLIDRAIQPDKIIIDKSGPAFNNKLLQGRINEINAQEAFDALSGKTKEIVLPHVAIKEFIKQGFENINATGNKKVRNATKSTNDAGIKFDSTLERYMYDLLTASKIHFEFQKSFELQAKFYYNGEVVRAISKIVDFYLPTRNIIIDTKGFSNDVSPLKHKMLKSVLKHLHDMQPEIIMPKNKKECDLLLNKLLYQK
jgi:hypothetical protein